MAAPGLQQPAATEATNPSGEAPANAYDSFWAAQDGETGLATVKPSAPETAPAPDGAYQEFLNR